MKFLELFGKFDIGEPPWDYDLLLNLDESEYPKYLAKIFNYRTDEKLPLRYDWKKRAWVIDKNKCKTFNQKIQWLKLYDATPLKKMCTDKVLVRDYVAEKIGEEYLKPVLQVISKEGVYINPVMLNSFQHLSNDELIEELSKNKTLIKVETDNSLSLFDKIDFDKLPYAFVMKCSHGCKWHYIVKNKEGFLSTKPLFELIKRNMTGWLEQDYSFWCGFEMQYAKSRRVESNEVSELDKERTKRMTGDSRNELHIQKKGISRYGLEPKIIIEPLFRHERNSSPREIEIYCFNGIPRIYVNVRYTDRREITFYSEDYSISDLILHPDGNNLIIKEQADDLLKQAVELSQRLVKTDTIGRSQSMTALNDNETFKFVRVDWLIYNNKLYFNELTFTPYSGFNTFDKKWNKKLGKMIKID